MARIKRPEFALDAAASVVADILMARATRNSNSIKSREICSMYELRTGFKMTDTQLREVVHHLRVGGLLPGLCASPMGYWVEYDRDAVMQYSKALRRRAESIMEAAVALERQARYMSASRDDSKFQQLSLFPIHTT